MSIEEQAEQLIDGQEVQETEPLPESEVEVPVSGEMPEQEPSEDDELIVTIGGDSPPQEEDDGFNGQPAPQWAKDLRKNYSEQSKEVKRLQKELDAKNNPQKVEPEKDLTLGNKPKLEEYAYDEDQYAEALDIWYDRKAQVEKRKAEVDAEQQKTQEQIQAVVNSYNEKKQQLKVRDFEDAESELTDKLSVQQQGLILEGADNPALVVYALGKNKARLDELAKITNPAKFAFAVARLETQMKTTTRKAAVAPEKTVTGSSSTSGTTDTTLDRLRKEAEKTGDYSKVVQHKRKLKQQK